jgi:hypothetical protein
MDIAQQDPNRTRAFARVLGPYLVVMTWFWVTGALALLIGLTIVASHTRWQGAPAIIVSLFGLLITAKGILLVALPQVSVSTAEFLLSRNGLWQALMVLMTLVGLYLTYVGWVPARVPAPESKAQAPDLPRAA